MTAGGVGSCTGMCEVYRTRVEALEAEVADKATILKDKRENLEVDYDDLKEANAKLQAENEKLRLGILQGEFGRISGGIRMQKGEF